MKKIIVIATVLASMVLVSCSSKERESGEHMMSDELEAIERAEEAADLIEQSGFDRQLEEVEEEADQ